MTPSAQLSADIVAGIPPLTALFFIQNINSTAVCNHPLFSTVRFHISTRHISTVLPPAMIHSTASPGALISVTSRLGSTLMSIFYSGQIFQTKFYLKMRINCDNFLHFDGMKMNRLCWPINSCHIKAALEHYQGEPIPPCNPPACKEQQFLKY